MRTYTSPRFTPPRKPPPLVTSTSRTPGSLADLGLDFGHRLLHRLGRLVPSGAVTRPELGLVDVGRHELRGTCATAGTDTRPPRAASRHSTAEPVTASRQRSMAT
jgi:hypothetical protein